MKSVVINDSYHSSIIPVCNILKNLMNAIGLMLDAFLKGVQAWDIRDRFFTQIRPVRVGDLGTGKKNKISQVGVLILMFSLRKSY